MKYIYYTITFFIVVGWHTILSGQGIHTEFGQNRVQYEKFKWQQYESERFITYWTQGGRKLGEYALQIGEHDIAELQNLLEYKMNDKIHLLVFNDFNDFTQSNAGSNLANYHNGGITRISDNKIYVYFNGSHQDLRRQVREGITEVFLRQMMYGNNLQEMVQNAVLLNLPHWFTGGLKAYIGEAWNADHDNLMRDHIKSGNYQKFSDLVNDDPRLAGHSMWYFISQNYGKSTVSNLLYLTRINRSIEQGFLFVLGNSFRKTSKEWYDFYQQRYLQENEKYELPEGETIALSNKQVSDVKIAPNGQHIAYTKQDEKRYKVILKDLTTQKERVLIKGSIYQNLQSQPDDTYPILAWNKSSELAVIFEKKGSIRIAVFGEADHKIKTTAKVSEILESITHADFINRRELIVSGIKDGQSDLFTLNTNGAQIRHITRDNYDERDVACIEINGQRSLLFASNRDQAKLKVDDPLPTEMTKTFDLYLMPFEKGSPRRILRITDTPFANERHPVQLDNTHFGWLADGNGMYNRYVGKLEQVLDFNEKYITLSDGNALTIPEDSTLTLADSITITDTQLKPVYTTVATAHPNTDYSVGILQQSTALNTKKTADLILNKGAYQLIINEIDTQKKYNLNKTSFRDRIQTKAPKPKAPQAVFDNVFTKIDTDKSQNVNKKEETGYLFQSEFEEIKTPDIEVTKEDKNEIGTVSPPVESLVKSKEKTYQPIDIRSGDVRDYTLKYRTDYLVVQFDNSLLFDAYTNHDHVSYNNTGNYYQWTPFSALFEAGIKDLMENESFRGGVRLPFELNFPEFYLIYSNKKKRLDKRFSFYRLPRIYGISSRNIVLKNITSYLETRLSYPLDTYRSVRGFVALRSDENVSLATDANSLSAPIDRQSRLFTRLEYVHDDTKNMGINMRTGTRYKVFAEVAKRFDLGLRKDVDAQIYPAWMTTFGLDARHYRKLTKNAIIATRLAGATSIGQEKNLYFMGGVDNWLIPSDRTNREVTVPASVDEFAFQTIATNMRGFKSNIRNGNSYIVWNTELRARLFNGISRASFRSSTFLRNLQAVAFADVGTAWQGPSPFNEDNPLNTIYVENPVVTVKVNYFRNPIVVGYGLGLRSVIFGHVVRVDYAWGLETKEVQPGQFYFSLGLDF